MIMRFYFILFSLILIGFHSLAHANNLAQQRAFFSQAQQALDKGDLNTFLNLTAQLSNYPLSFYLQYRYLEPRVETLSHHELLGFLTQYGDTGHGDLLRRKWLYILAKRNDWPTFVAAMQGHTLDDDLVTLRCHNLTAQLNVGQSLHTLKEEALSLWLVGKSQPRACDPAFNALSQQGFITDDLIWQRIHLAMANGEVTFATHLGDQFRDSRQTQWIPLWQAMHRNAATTLSQFNAPDQVIARDIIVHGIRVIAKNNYSQADQFWQSLRPRYAFDVTQLGAIKTALAVAAFQQKHPNAYVLMTALLEDELTQRLQESRFHSALRQLDWAAIADLVTELPADKQTNYQWRYWYARALMQTGKKDANGNDGKTLLSLLAKERDYYGFLAADQLKLPHHVLHIPTPSSPAKEAQLLKHPSMAAAQEFYHLDLQTHARREWQYLMKRLPNEQVAIAALLANRWGWYDRAIFTMAQAGFYDDLNVRFPLAYYDELLNGAKSQQLDLAWVYGITRQESAFMHSARSHAGALGLMQLMPTTGRYVARKIGLPIKNNNDILKLDNNVMLGTAYLKQMLQTFNGNYMLATAAYNAGPGRAKRWAQDNGCLPTDVFVELIPFEETRTYVKRVLFYTRIFENQLRRTQTQSLRLSLDGHCSR